MPICVCVCVFLIRASEVALQILHRADTIIVWINFYKLGAAKAKKGRKAALDTSASEVINLNENAVSLTALYLFILIFYYRNQCPNQVLKADSSHNLTF